MKKWIGNNWLSTIAFGLSIIAICLTICRIEPIDFNNGSMVSFVVGLMGICATIMVGMQIYSTIYSEEKINRRINEEGKKIKYEFDSNLIRALFRVEIIVMNLLVVDKNWEEFAREISLLSDYVIDLQDSFRAKEVSKILMKIDNEHHFYDQLSFDSKEMIHSKVLNISKLIDNPRDLLNRFT